MTDSNSSSQDLSGKELDPQDPAPSGRRRLGLGCGIFLVLVLAALTYARRTANSILKTRIERVEIELQKAEGRLLQKRRYPFKEQREDEASRYYRGIDWLSSDPNLTMRLTSPNLPMLERGLWTGKANDLQTHGQTLSKLLDQSTKPARIQQTEIDAAKAFVATHGQTLVELLRSGVTSDHVRWPVDLKEGINLEISNLSTQRSAANVALYMASKQSASEAIELALLVYCYGRDHRYHPSLIGSMIGVAIEHIAMISLERRLNREGAEPDKADLERILEAFAAMPVHANHAFDFETIGFDSTLARLVTEKDPQLQKELFGDAARFVIPEYLIWQWGALDRYRNEIAPVWTLPLDQARALDSQVREKLHQERGAALARVAIPNILALRVLMIEAQAHAELIRLAAAAKLYRIQRGDWPEEPDDLDQFFGGEAPRDPLASGADFIFEIVDGTWTVSAANINRPLRITLLAQRPAKTGD